MSNLDGDAVYKNLKKKIDKCEDLTKEEILSLTFIILVMQYKSFTRINFISYL
ncbi:hypothetical protein [Clostridium cochlearium]|uniref:hypothetical protein n=1 Tax=Clostridium cochlearium TaxID=1494 RepID=UPI00241C68B6|nr:hypothetical protein [Clostridium cochlearium]